MTTDTRPTFHRDDLIRMVTLPTAEVEFRASDNGSLGTLEGYAAVFNEDTMIDSWEGHFVERIAPGAFAKTLKDRGDKIKVLFNHGFDPQIGDKPLGKPSSMTEDKRGLRVEVPLDDTSYNRDLVASLRSGALDGMSFRFSVTREEIDESEEIPVRTLREVKLHEFGPVTFPAYEATIAGVRAREAYQAWRATQTAQPVIEVEEEISTEEVEQDLESDAAAPGTSDERTDTPPAEAPVENVAEKRRRYAESVRARKNEVLTAIGLDNEE